MPKAVRPDDRLALAIESLARARSLDEVLPLAAEAARELTGADGVAFVLRDGDQCYYAEESAIGPLWKGKRFPMTECISGWVMMNRQAAAIEDVYSDPRIPHAAYRATFVKSMAMVPVRDNDPIAALGAYWATRRRATQAELQQLKVLADTSALVLGQIARDGG